MLPEMGGPQGTGGIAGVQHAARREGIELKRIGGRRVEVTVDVDHHIRVVRGKGIDGPVRAGWYDGGIGSIGNFRHPGQARPPVGPVSAT